MKNLLNKPQSISCYNYNRQLFTCDQKTLSKYRSSEIFVIFWMRNNYHAYSICCGQAYDGAADMCGARKGAASIIAAEYPLAVYSHCKSHVLNLALVKACRTI